MSIKYAKQHNMPLIRKITPRTFGSIKPGEKFRIKYKTKPFGVISYGSWEKCDHCKRHHELCLNYDFENNSSSWADMMEKDLKWNKQQDLDDENQEATHNIES